MREFLGLGSVRGKGSYFIEKRLVVGKKIKFGEVGIGLYC